MIKKYNQQFSFNISTTDKVTQNLPPTSAQSFLRENLTFPAVVLSSNPQNRFYHSIFDDQDNIKFQYFNTTQDFTVATPLNDNVGFPGNSIQLAIRNVSTVLAASLYQMITGVPYGGENGSNPILVSGHGLGFVLVKQCFLTSHFSQVDELLYCFLISSECPLFTAAAPKKLPERPDAPPPLR